MTDNEIIKALEICSHRNGDLPCEGCPAYSIAQMCMEDLMSDAFDLINRKNAEIERLQDELIISKGEEIKLHDDMCVLKDELHRAKVEISKHFDYMDEAKSEAIKEFADRLKEHRYGELHNRISFSVEYLDNLVKEMTKVEINQRKEDEKR